MAAYQQDEAAEAALGSRRGEELPAELARREARLAKMEAARRRLEAEAQAEADAERQRCLEADAERQRSGKKRRGKAPQEIDETPADTAQMSCTILSCTSGRRTTKGGLLGNAQARGWGLPEHCGLRRDEATNAKQQAEPMGQAILEPLKQAVAMALPRNEAGEGTRSRRRVDSGYDSEAATQALEALGFEPYIATARQRHHAPAPKPWKATAKERMAAQVRSPAGQGVVQPSQGHRSAGIWSDQGGVGAVVFCCEVGPRCGAHGAWYAWGTIYSSCGAMDVP